jgi:hypothetical protein
VLFNPVWGATVIPSVGPGQFHADAIWTCTDCTGILCAMIKLVISGGQSGADQAGWRAAEACGIATGGWMPAGFLTEDGPRPEFAELYGALEMPTDSYPERTLQNVRDSDGAVFRHHRHTGRQNQPERLQEHGQAMTSEELMCRERNLEARPPSTSATRRCRSCKTSTLRPATTSTV